MIHLTQRKKEEMEDVSYSVNLLNGMFFFILILSSGFTDEILNCKYQKLLSTNIYVKHLLCLMILYYIDSTVISEQEHFPMIKFRNVIILYIIFIIVMRQNKNFTITLFILIFVIHILHEYQEYYRKKNEDSKIQLKLHNSILIISGITILLAVVGLIINYFQRKTEYGKGFSSIKFILGNTSCSR